MEVLTKAIRSGLFYCTLGSREIGILCPPIDSRIIEAIERFRAESYGDVPAVVNGRNQHRSDAKAYHVVMIDGGRILGCARYLQGEVVELGGFVVAADVRASRVAMHIVTYIKTLAAHLGDTKFKADASVEFGCASMLKKLGGVVTGQYFDENYKRNVELIVWDLKK